MQHLSQISFGDAASRGASDGLQLALNIGAMLIAFIGLIALVNGILGAIHSTRAFFWVPGSMQIILGRIFAPVAWLLGVKYLPADTAAVARTV